jgi:HSP20 family protein
MAVLVRRAAQPGAASSRVDPFGEIQELHNRTEQLMQSLLSGATPAGDGGGGGAPWVPLVDIEETDDAWILEAEVPGVKKKDVHVDMNGDELVIRGDIKERERKGILRRRTRRTGEFEFRVTLPGGVDADSVDASLDDGVVTVRVPKPQPVRSRQIEVTSGQAQNGGQAQQTAATAGPAASG